MQFTSALFQSQTLKLSCTVPDKPPNLPGASQSLSYTPDFIPEGR